MKPFLPLFALALAASPASGTEDARKPAAQALSDSPSLKTMQAWVKAAGDDHKPEAAAVLVSFLEHEQTAVRWQAASVLGMLGDTSVTPALIRRLEDPQWVVRQFAAEALGRLRAKSAAPQVARLLQDTDANVQRAALRALGEIGDATFAPRIAPFLNDPPRGMRMEAVDALAALEARDHAGDIASILEEKGLAAGARLKTAEALIRIGNLSVAPKLAGLLTHGDPDVRNAAAHVLGGLRAVAYGPRLARLLDNAASRLAALGALGALGDRDLAPAVAACLQDERSLVREEAAKALGRLVAQAWGRDLAGVTQARAWWLAHRDDPEFNPQRR